MLVGQAAHSGPVGGQLLASRVVNSSRVPKTTATIVFERSSSVLSLKAAGIGDGSLRLRGWDLQKFGQGRGAGPSRSNGRRPWAGHAYVRGIAGLG